MYYLGKTYRKKTLSPLKLTHYEIQNTAPNRIQNNTEKYEDKTITRIKVSNQHCAKDINNKIG